MMILYNYLYFNARAMLFTRYAREQFFGANCNLHCNSVFALHVFGEAANVSKLNDSQTIILM